MSTKKTIQINPELFKMPGNKTRKNIPKKKIELNPVISPSNLKNTLLKRIKEHKTRELNETLAKPNTIQPLNTNNDEFYGAIDYLSRLKQKKKQEQILHNKTIKNQTSPLLSSNQQVLLDLPPELTEPIKPSIISNEVLNINYKTNDNIPYGCLKNGKKKTYREWKELTAPSYPELETLIRPPTPPKKTDGVFFTNLNNTNTYKPPLTETIVNASLSREDRLEQIKNKLRKLEDNETSSKRKAIEDFKNMEKKLIKPLEKLDELQYIEDNKNVFPEIEEVLKKREEDIEKTTPKQYLKKTVKRKFTLGKSDKLRRIGVLIKDRQTRKNIINTQNELKKRDITDVRKYLREHGIIKVGSTCPNDILRKTFESAVLTGEITNTNKETLLHNFLHEKT